ncbi:MAG: hypothetical protein A2V57_08100 [Candidatus Aminicenantes bacterium RBG_19FT_COMBO_65_30]|nr:MAG: hypothetical protein A2V57_08100 [Candidatus Aminicenantes bacterium RBG_19FT_COMBO_65_30]
MKKRIANVMVLALLVAGTCGWAVAQAKEEPPDRAVVPLTNPAKPAKIEVSVIRGSITVKAYEGKEVIVEARVREKALSGYLPGLYSTGEYAVVAPPAPPGAPASVAAPAPAPMAVPSAKAGQLTEKQQKELQAAVARMAEHQEQLARTLADQEVLAKRLTQSDRARNLYNEYFQDDKKRREEKEKKIAGMKQLSGSTSGLEIEEEDNVVQISTESWKAATDLVIQVPRATSLEVRSTMDGAVVVEGVSGEIDINNINGPVTLKNVSGNTLVHTVNGDIEVVLARVAADKPLSFSTMHGDIDVTLPADVKANLKMKSEQGEIYSDFDINMTRQTPRSEAAEKTEQGKYRISFDKSLYGIVNGGGQEIGFNTYSGNIYIRKKK